MMYRYLDKESDSNDGTRRLNLIEKKESTASVMHLTQDFTDLNADEKTRLLIGLLDDIHDCAAIMQHRSLSF